MASMEVGSNVYVQLGKDATGSRVQKAEWREEMMEIHFRAWDKTLNKWLNPDDVKISISGKLVVRSTGSLIDFARYVELMQYAGLKDKNGKESYFDDVLKWRDSTFRIVWDDECALAMLKRLSGTDGMSKIPAHNIKQGEVIGNIWENPELLGK